jgi:hypothetical protein
MISRKNAFAAALVGLCAFFGATAPAFAQQGEARTYALPEVTPTEYKGDLRNLPPSYLPPRYVHMWNEFDGPDHPRPSKMPVAPHRPIVANAPMPASNTFAGLKYTDLVTGGTAGAGIPPDTNGDVGPTVYIQAVNDAFGIYDKATGTRLAAFTENQLWSVSGASDPCLSQNEGDPVVLHDGLADRWILTNFAFKIKASGGTQKPYYQCFAVSKTSDPVAGGWNFYAVRIDTGVTGQPPQGDLNDYGKFGLWNDGCLYGAFNMFPASGYAGVAFASFNTVDMYAGATLRSSLGLLAYPANDAFSLVPSNLQSKTSASLPPVGTPNYFVSETINTPSSFGYLVRKFTPAANCGAGGTLSAPVTVSQGAYAVNLTTTDFVPQPATTQQLDTLQDRIMQKVQYRRIGTSESLWVVHTVGDGTSTPAQPQWAQLDVSGGTIASAPVQEQIYAPDATLSRWMGSLAVDAQGNMAVGYSTSSSAAFPGIAYSGRLHDDVPNQLPQTEAVLQTGAGSQITYARWGDYSSMSVDPSDDCTFWYTNEFLAATGVFNWSTAIGSFKFPNCGLATYTITASSDTNGGISPSGAVVVNNGNTQAFTLSPNTGYHTASVTGTCPAGLLSGNSYTTDAITFDCTVMANFAIDIYTLTYNTDGNGTISGTTPQSVAYGSDGTAVTAMPNPGYHFVQWSDGNPSATRTDTNVQGDITVTAQFAIDTFTLTYNTDGNGTISGTTPQTVNFGSDGSAVTAVPNAGYNFDHWDDALTANPRTDTNVQADITVTAIFTPETQLVFTSVPTTVVAGATTSVDVSIEDANNNVVASDSATVVSLVDSVCGTTVATLQASSGVAHFTNLSFHSVGSHTLHASGTSEPVPTLAESDSSAFSVTADPDWIFANGFETCVP